MHVGTDETIKNYVGKKCEILGGMNKVRRSVTSKKWSSDSGRKWIGEKWENNKDSKEQRRERRPEICAALKIRWVRSHFIPSEGRFQWKDWTSRSFTEMKRGTNFFLSACLDKGWEHSLRYCSFFFLWFLNTQTASIVCSACFLIPIKPVSSSEPGMLQRLESARTWWWASSAAAQQNFSKSCFKIRFRKKRS